MVRIETTTWIGATPEQVWDVLVDFAGYAGWSPHMTLSGTPQVGQRLRLTAAAPGGKGMRFRPRVLAAEPGRELTWRGRVLLPGLCDGVHAFLLTPEDGGTRLVQAEDFTGLLVPFLSRGLADTERHMHEQNAALARRVEQVSARA